MKAIGKQEPVGKCKMNHMGSFASMETEDVKRIFLRSENDCSDESDSWCRFKQDKANQTSNYMFLDIIKLIKPIFLRLGSNELLSKCLDGKTQNQNKSINGMIWKRIPKNIFVRFDVLEFGIYDAVAHFNIGAEAAAFSKK